MSYIRDTTHVQYIRDMTHVLYMKHIHRSVILGQSASVNYSSPRDIFRAQKLVSGMAVSAGLFWPTVGLF